MRRKRANELHRLTLKPYQILQASSRICRISIDEIMGLEKMRDICRARFLVAALLRYAFPHWTTSQTARFMMRADHGTILNARKRAAALMESDSFFQKAFDQSLDFLTNQTNA